jgi:hypothetical protein
MPQTAFPSNRPVLGDGLGDVRLDAGRVGPRPHVRGHSSPSKVSHRLHRCAAAHSIQPARFCRGVFRCRIKLRRKRIFFSAEVRCRNERTAASTSPKHRGAPCMLRPACCALHAAPCMLRPACSMMLVSTAIVHARLTLLLQHGATDTDAGALAHCHQPSDAVARHQQWYARES